ncbi:DNA alkylation repair protein [Lentilactobacillus senioris]|uniref:DNA alkylation repair protein n=1 Tax=Lentilactobacillus senioris TaxID=931534 RepID=UPI00227E1B34|nr:DNA alkylation repair protein [Lentilactobacillus senioris]MCY9806273.1 DNA alkylation repair protein [Lentilactobacillus senioris]
MNFELNGQVINREPMERYMKNKFPFAGVKSPDRKLQERELLKQSRNWDTANLISEIQALYQKPEREYHYVAIDLAQRNYQRFSLKELKSLLLLVDQKAWWDTVDSWRKVFASYVIKFPEYKSIIFNWFFQNESMWLRRISIIFQLTEKETLDTEMLTEAIEVDQYTNEFFLQKAIGWALRNYSKVKPGWVGDFIATHELSNLAQREASKYLNN